MKGTDQIPVGSKKGEQPKAIPAAETETVIDPEIIAQIEIGKAIQKEPSVYNFYTLQNVVFIKVNNDYDSISAQDLLNSIGIGRSVGTQQDFKEIRPRYKARAEKRFFVVDINIHSERYGYTCYDEKKPVNPSEKDLAINLDNLRLLVNTMSAFRKALNTCYLSIAPLKASTVADILKD